MSGLFEPSHLLIILSVALIVFGPKRLPELGRSLGRGIREFRDSVSTEDKPDHDRPALPAGAAVKTGDTTRDSNSTPRATES